MAGTVKGSPDGPKYIYGKKNINYQGTRRASGSAISGSEDSVRSDFSSSEPYDFDDEKVSVEDADLDTPLKDIDFEDYEGSDFGEPYLVNSEQGHNVYIQSYGDNDVTMTYEFEDNPRNTILSLLDGGVDEVEELEYDPFGSDEDIVSDEYYEAYDDALQSFAQKEGLSLDQEILENDYGRLSFYHSADPEEDPDYTVENLHDNFNGAYNAFTYRLPDSFRSDFEHALKEKGISTHDLADKVEAIRKQAEEDEDLDYI